ncbi:MAG: hypothetical protein GF344_06260 [Chitinivibrionales bacterium]|nr:hypothetical protein [Chitinivibrionales bacterium]MBD3356536.1 hypothetical protein [Chitinivibrionales bacterium]
MNRSPIRIPLFTGDEETRRGLDGEVEEHGDNFLSSESEIRRVCLGMPNPTIHKNSGFAHNIRAKL